MSARSPQTRSQDLLRNLGIMLVSRMNSVRQTLMGIQPPKGPQTKTIVFTNVSPGSLQSTRGGNSVWIHGGGQ